MRRAWIALLSCLAALAVYFAGLKPAHAEPVAIAILPIDSEDAEDQAEALTTALRSRVRDMNGLKVAETVQSLGMLTGALKCGRVPDAACQAKIADQLKLDRFIWGTMQRSPGAQVTVDLHFFQRGKPDAPIRESYSDNLKDQNDDTLRKVTQRLIDRLLGRTTGTVVLHTNPGLQGELVVDGSRRIPFEKGAGRYDIAFGQHTIEVTARGYTSQKREVSVPPGSEVPLDVTLVAGDGEHKPLIDSKSMPVRKILGFGSIGLGAAAGVVSTIFAVQWMSLNGDQAELIAKSPQGLDVCSVEAQQQTQNGGGSATEACKASDKAKGKSVVAWTFGGVAVVGIGVGVFLVLTDKGGSEARNTKEPATPKSALSRVRAIPDVGPQGGSLTLTGSF